MALASRQDLQDYSLRRLGHPVIEINVEDGQVSDRIDDALQFFQEYHFDGVERVFVSHQIVGSKLKLTTNIAGNFRAFVGNGFLENLNQDICFFRKHIFNVSAFLDFRLDFQPA